MIYTELKLRGAYLIELEPVEDERGFFARAFCTEEFENLGIDMRIVQCNVSLNSKQGTLRGMHYQSAPYEETKLIRCTMGAIYDVIIDLRTDSPTFKQWVAHELTALNRKMVYAPKGFAHGFQTLVNNCEIFYFMSESYHPECAQGVRWDDPAFGIRWPPADERVISKNDLSYALFSETGG